MLTITRRPGEQIIIFNPDGSILGTISLNRGANHTRIGLDFPREYKIQRAEFLEPSKESPCPTTK